MALKTALVVEDNVEIGRIYTMTLDIVGYATELIIDGKDALTRLGELIPNLVILDMNLPQVSGHYIYKKLRSDPRFKNTHIIISTANAVVAQALSNEVTDFDRVLMKPVSAHELRDLAAEVFQIQTS